MRGTARATGMSYNAVARMLISVGKVAIEFHDEHVRNVKAEYIQCDEMWSYVYARQEHLPGIKEPLDAAGDVWTWLAIERDSKLLISWVIGDRGQLYSDEFMQDLASRVYGRVKLSTDGHASYPYSINSAFADHDHDYVRMVRERDEGGRRSNQTTKERYKRLRPGEDDSLEGFTQSHIERLNLTARQSMRRYMRKTTGFSKKLENHIYHTAIYAVWYNWVRPHMTLVEKIGVPTTPAMAAGLATRPFRLKDLIALTDYKNRPGKRGPYKPRQKRNGIVRPNPKEVKAVRVDDLKAREMSGSTLVRTLGYVPPTIPPGV